MIFFQKSLKNFGLKMKILKIFRIQLSSMFALMQLTENFQLNQEVNVATVMWSTKLCWWLCDTDRLWWLFSNLANTVRMSPTSVININVELVWSGSIFLEIKTSKYIERVHSGNFSKSYLVRQSTIWVEWVFLVFEFSLVNQIFSSLIILRFNCIIWLLAT